MGNEVEEALQPLGGLPLCCVGRAADLLWMHFGEWRETTDHRGKPRTVGEWALHVQCPWRFVRATQIVVAKYDLHRDAETDEPFDWNAGRKSRFDLLAAPLNAELASAAHHVAGITGDAADGFRLEFLPELALEVFPCASTSSPRREFWRLFQPATEDRHVIFGTVGSGTP